MSRLVGLLRGAWDWLYNWKVTLFGQHGEHDTAEHKDDAGQ